MGDLPDRVCLREFEGVTFGLIGARLELMEASLSAFLDTTLPLWLLAPL